jgi:hypothetical protein
MPALSDSTEDHGKSVGGGAGQFVHSWFLQSNVLMTSAFPRESPVFLSKIFSSNGWMVIGIIVLNGLLFRLFVL